MTFIKSKRVNILIVLALIFMLPMSLIAHEKDKHKKKADSNEVTISPHQYLDGGEKAPDFTLINQNGKETSLKKLKGNSIILTPIYTACPDACPLVLHNREKIQKTLEKDIGKDPIFLAITVDPEHDTPEVLKEYMTRLSINPTNFHFLSGDPEKVNKVVSDYKIRVRIDAENGNVLGHSVIGYVIDSDGIIKKAVQFAQ